MVELTNPSEGVVDSTVVGVVQPPLVQPGTVVVGVVRSLGKAPDSWIPICQTPNEACIDGGKLG